MSYFYFDGNKMIVRHTTTMSLCFIFYILGYTLLEEFLCLVFLAISLHPLKRVLCQKRPKKVKSAIGYRGVDSEISFQSIELLLLSSSEADPS